MASELETGYLIDIDNNSRDQELVSSQGLEASRERTVAARYFSLHRTRSPPPAPHYPRPASPNPLAETLPVLSTSPQALPPHSNPHNLNSPAGATAPSFTY